MRLTKEKIPSTYNLNSNKQTQIHHNKNSSMDMISPSKSKNIYLNKILQKNLGTQRANIDQTTLQKNIPNFQSSIQSILANEETRQKAKNYVLQMRCRQGQNSSPSKLSTDSLKSKNANFSKTNYDGFYDMKHRKNASAILQDNNYKFNYSNNYIRNNSNSGREIKKEILLKEKTSYPEFNNHMNINVQTTPDKVIRVNKIHKYYEEIPSFSPGESNNIYYKNNIGMNRNHSRGVFNYNNNLKENNNISNMKKFKSSNTNYPLNNNKRQIYYNNKQYTDIYQNPSNNNYQNYNNSSNIYKDENDLEEGNIENLDNNGMETNSLSENNNSGLREIVIDNINEIYQSPEILNRKNDDYNYNNFNDEKNSSNKKQNEYSIGTYNKYRPINQNKNSNNNKKPIQIAYTKSNSNSSHRKINDKTNINRFNNNLLKVAKINRFRIRRESNKGSNINYNSDIMQRIKNKFLENIRAIKNTEISIIVNNTRKFRIPYNIRTNINNANNSNNNNEIKQIKIELE